MNDELKVQLNLLIDILNKKFNMLQEILAITENQGIVLKSAPEDRQMFMSMFEEKQIRIDNISSGDDIFNRLFNDTISEVKTQKTSYKEQISSMQKLVKAIMDTEIKIRLEERNNTKYMQRVINVVPMKIAIREYSNQKNRKITDAIKKSKFDSI